MIACVLIPYFAAALEHKAQTKDNTPLVVIEYRGQRGKVIAFSDSARTMGVERGISLSKARAFCPQATFLTADPQRYAKAHDALMNVLWDFTNRVEIDEAAYPQTVIAYLDLGNLKTADLEYIGSFVCNTLRDRLSLRPSVGISQGKLTAYVAAVSTPRDHVTLVPREAEAAFIAPHPVHLLPLDKEQARRLHILGIKTLGDLAAIPRASVIAQFGKAGGLLHLLASGLDGRPVRPARMPEQEAVRRQFEPLSDRTWLDVRVWELAEALADKLDGRRSALHQLTVTVHFERGKPLTQGMHLFEPVTSARAIGDTILKLLERMTLSQPVSGLEVCASHLVPALPRQLELFSERSVRQQLLDLTSALAAQYSGVGFYHVQPGAPLSLLPERRYRLQRVEVS